MIHSRQYPVLLAAALLLALFTTTGMAGEYRTAMDLTTEDRDIMRAGSQDYQRCLATEMNNVPGHVTDPRILADAAMHACNQVLIDVEGQLINRGFAPGFGRHYVQSTQQRASRDLLQLAMMLAIERENAAATEEQ